MSAAGDRVATAIPEARLVELRHSVRDAGSHRFVDPHAVSAATTILDRRGEAWAAAVLGRDLSRRSLGVPTRPYFHDGELHILIAADTDEDLYRIAPLDSP